MIDDVYNALWHITLYAVALAMFAWPAVVATIVGAFFDWTWVGLGIGLFLSVGFSCLLLERWQDQRRRESNA
jgi:membrane protein implicated in regulation of membrane protease activity